MLNFTTFRSNVKLIMSLYLILGFWFQFQCVFSIDCVIFNSISSCQNDERFSRKRKFSEPTIAFKRVKSWYFPDIQRETANWMMIVIIKLLFLTHWHYRKYNTVSLKKNHTLIQNKHSTFLQNYIGEVCFSRYLFVQNKNRIG